MIDWEYLCHGIEWVSTKEEQKAPYPFELEKVQRPGKPPTLPGPTPPAGQLARCQGSLLYRMRRA